MEIIVLITTKDKSQAQEIAKKLVEEKLIACANIIGEVNSIFSWEGKIDEATESLIVIKTQRKLFKELEKRVKSLHSYDVPEIIALPIIDGHKPYLSWVRQSTSSSKQKEKK